MGERTNKDYIGRLVKVKAIGDELDNDVCIVVGLYGSVCLRIQRLTKLTEEEPLLVHMSDIEVMV